MHSYTFFNAVCLALCAVFVFGTAFVFRTSSVEAKVPVIEDILVVERAGIEKEDVSKVEERAEEEKNEKTNEATSRDLSQDEKKKKTVVEAKETLPAKINLAVPFTSQAPERNWDQPWQDACEEAAVLMLEAYYKKFGLSPLFARDEILKMVSWEDEKNWGYSIEIEKVQSLAANRLGNSFGAFTIIEDPTVEQIQQSLAAGHPVLAVADGKALPNPYFSGDGPEYHALVIRGYTEDSFITNDPGTWRGENFVYKHEDLMNAIRDWNGGDVKNGKRAVLVLE